MSCLRIRQMTPFGNMHVKVSVAPITCREREVSAQLGKGGEVANSDLEATCRIMSLTGGLATALERYLIAKEEHGLHSLLLGHAVMRCEDGTKKSEVAIKKGAPRNSASKRVT